MITSNDQILKKVRDTMNMMLASATTDDWDNVTHLDKMRIELLSKLKQSEYTGDLRLIDEIVDLDKVILETAQNSKSILAEKLTTINDTKYAHRSYSTVAKL